MTGRHTGKDTQSFLNPHRAGWVSGWPRAHCTHPWCAAALWVTACDYTAPTLGSTGDTGVKEAPGCHSVELGNRLSKGQVTGSQLLVQRTEGGGSGCDTSSWLLGSISHLPIIFKLFLPESPGVKLNPGQDLSGPVWSSHSMFSSLPRSSYPCLLSASLLPQGLCTRWSLCLECLFFFFIFTWLILWYPFLTENLLWFFSTLGWVRIPSFIFPWNHVPLPALLWDYAFIWAVIL